MAAIIRFDLDVSKMTATTAVKLNEVQIHQQKTEKGLPLSSMILNSEGALSIPVPSCSSWKQKVCNIFSFKLVLLSVWHRLI